MNKQDTIQLYTTLDENYDVYAKSLALLNKQIQKFDDYKEKIAQDVAIIYRRLELYVKNEFWNNYSTDLHTFLITNDQKFKIFPQEEFKSINAKYDFIESDKDFISQDLDEVFNIDFDFEMDFNNEEKSRHDKIDFVDKHIKTVLFCCDINKKQQNTLDNIVNSYKELFEKKNYICSRKDEATTEYEDLLDELTMKLMDDEHYDFNIDEDSIMTVREEDSYIWHIIYYKESNLSIIDKKEGK